MDNGLLFSVAIICYRNFKYLKDAIDSVLIQDYPRIELVVSDDGSGQFPIEEFNDYILEHKKSNICQFSVRSGSENVGTVRHLNQVRKLLHGDYICFLAGDDQFYDEHVLSSYAEAFSRAPDGCLVEMAQTAMFDEDMRSIQSLYMTQEVEDALIETKNDSSTLLTLLISKGACLPSTSTCFRSGFFSKFGDFDESFLLVEDYPMHFRLAKEGWVIHCEKFIAIKHRHGGISHGHKGALKKSQIMYLNDTKKMIKDYQLENANLLPPGKRRSVIRQKKAELLWIDMQFARSERGGISMISVAAKHPGYFIDLCISKGYGILKKATKWMIIICLLSWILNPCIVDLVSSAFNVDPDSVRPICVGLSQVLLVMSGIAFVFFLISFFYKRISTFPSKVIKK